MAAVSTDYGSTTLPEDLSPPTSSKRALASVVVAVLLFAAAGAAALNPKTTATAPTALAAYDGSGVAWDCAVPDSQVAASNGPASGTIESAGYILSGYTPTSNAMITLDSGKETTFNSEEVTFEVHAQGQPYAWAIKDSLIDSYFDCGGLQVVDASSSVLMGCDLGQAITVGNPVVNKAPSATPALARLVCGEYMDRSGTITVVVFTSPTEWYMSQYKTHLKMDSGPWPGYDGASSCSLATAAAVAVAAVAALA